MSLEEKLADLREKYREFLRQGKTEDATEVARKAERLKDGEESESSEDIDERFESLNGVGEELARELAEDFGSFDDLKQASVEDLTPIPGIGEKRAKSIIEQAKGE